MTRHRSGVCSTADRSRQPKKAPKIVGGGCGEFDRRQVSHRSEGFRYCGDMGGLVSLAAQRLRSKVGRIGFRQQAGQGQLTGYVAQILSFGVGHIGRERYQEPHLNSLPGLGERAGKTVEDAAQAAGAPMPIEYLEAIGPSLPAMDDDRQTCGAGQIKLLDEDALLNVARGMIVMVVEADFAPGQEVWMLWQGDSAGFVVLDVASLASCGWTPAAA